MVGVSACVCVCVCVCVRACVSVCLCVCVRAFQFAIRFVMRIDSFCKKNRPFDSLVVMQFLH